MHPIQRLEQLAHEFRHLQAEHERKQIESRARRREETRLKETEQRFRRLLEHWVLEAGERQAWCDHLYRGGTVPASSLAEAPLFKGRAENGSVAEIRRRSDGEIDIIIDGASMGPLSSTYELTSSVRAAGAEFDETFEAPAPALEALLAFLSRPSSEVPWAHARELFEDGLIDENWSLTPRGQRFKRRAS